MITPTKLGEWTVSVGQPQDESDVRIFQEKGAVLAFVREATAGSRAGRIFADEDCGQSSWSMRFLGGAPRIRQPHFAMEWCDEVCSLIFFDDANSEYRALDKEQPVSASVEARHQIAHGELQPHPLEECLALTRGLKAIEDYLATGERPAQLEYRYVA